MEKKELNFEKSMTELEKIANELESEELSLDDSVKKFEEGMELANKCNKILENAEKRITVIIDGEEKDFQEKE